MRDDSAKTMWKFLLRIIWGFSIGFIWCKNLIFGILPHQRVSDSLNALFAIILVWVVVFMLAVRNHRNSCTAAACFVLGLYTMMAKVRRSVYQRCILAISCIFTIAMVSLTIGIGWHGCVEQKLMYSSAKMGHEVVESTKADMLSSHMETILKLKPIIWEQQSTHERLNILQTVCDIEVQYLGLSDLVTVQGAELSQHTLGTYCDDSKLVCISIQHIENDPVEEVLNTLLHEVHHSYEYRLAETFKDVKPKYQNLRIFQEASHYAQELNDYINPKENYYGYSSQYLELNSNTYAEIGVQEYYSQIDAWS